MRQVKMYTYVSKEGTVFTPINLGIGNPDITYKLIADKNKILTNGIQRFEVTEAKEEEIDLWQEVDKTSEEIEEDNNSNISTDSTDYEKIIDILTGEQGDDK